MKQDPRITRRNFMAAAGGTIVSIGLPGVFVKWLEKIKFVVRDEPVAATAARGPTLLASSPPVIKKLIPRPFLAVDRSATITGAGT